MIQILQQRPYTDESGLIHKPMKFLENKISCNSVAELFFNLDKILLRIPEKERYNIHYTLCECYDDERPRQFKAQNVIPFDIDGIDASRINDYIDPIIDAIGTVNRSDILVISSGRGLHFVIGTTHYITNKDEFTQTKSAYAIVAKRINAAIKKLQLPGKTDVGLWSANHTLRLPGTKNIKTPELGYKEDFIGECTLLGGILKQHEDLTITMLAGGDMIVDNDDSVPLTTTALGGKYPVDTEGVLSGCHFLKWCYENQERVTEPQWYAMLSITAQLDGGDNISHMYSEKHPKYSFAGTNAKIEQAKTCSGPRTCANINSLWEGCSACPFYQKVKSPISIKGENYLKTKETGFRNTIISKEGFVVRREVNRDELAKFYEQTNEYRTTNEGVIYGWKDGYYDVTTPRDLNYFCQKHVNPSPSISDCREFSALIERSKGVDKSWLSKSVFQKINLKNGVLDMSFSPPKLIPHSQDYAFMGVLDYDYDESAKCPMWDKFLMDVTLNRPELINILQEFMGYAFSNSKPYLQKALFLSGKGENGKSTFMRVIKALAGDGSSGASFSSLSLSDLNDPNKCAQLEGKLFNMSEETPKKGLEDSSIFKKIVTGEELTVKRLYINTYDIRPTVKLIMAANDLPATNDISHGFFRRFLIVPFNNMFNKELGNVDKKIEDKLLLERSGILNWVIDGWVRLQKNGEFTESNITREEIENYKREVDVTYNFIDDCLEIKTQYTEYDECSATDLYKAYAKWSDQNGFNHKLNSAHLMKKLSFIIPSFKSRKHKKTSGSYYKGIKIIADNVPF